MNLPKIIGLTGGIGSGKTTVAKLFKKLGVSIYVSDDEAKKITNKPEILLKIKSVFGDFVFDKEVLNRKRLGEIVFKNPNKLSELNAIIHPEVKKDFDKWLIMHSDEKFIIKESAILIETGEYKNCEAVICITASLENRIKRLKKRDNLSEKEIIMRINSQISDEERLNKSIYIIKNDIKNISQLQVEVIFRQLISKY